MNGQMDGTITIDIQYLLYDYLLVLKRKIMSLLKSEKTECNILN